MKLKKRFVCKECGCVSNSWLGKCPECNSWSSFVEEIIEEISKSTLKKSPQSKPVKIQEVLSETDDSIMLNNSYLNDFFGNGIVKGSVILLSGEPGIGKSTFLFFLSNNVNREHKIYYFSGEESSVQIKKRFDRVGNHDSSVFVSNSTDVDNIISICKTENPSIIYIDSIQTVFSLDVDSAPGTISQIKKTTQQFIELSKTLGIITIIVCHITKSGEIAGPKVIEHMVDMVTYFDTDLKNQYRILRSKKNRFGTIDDILFFEMENKGLKLINNPSTFFLQQDSESLYSGKTKSVVIEGKRPLIIEIESLVVPSSYPNPRRISEGIELSRLNRIIAILEKHTNENLSNHDIYVNITGGIKSSDVGIDLAIATAIYSSKNKIIINNKYVFIGELSLTGQVNKVYKSENRIKEAEKFGFEFVVGPFPEKNLINHISFIKEVLL